MQWSIDGFTWQIYNTQSFKISGTNQHIDGPDLLEQVFNKYDIHSWGMFGTLIGYVVFFRVTQYLLFAIQTGMLKLPFSKSSDEEGGKSTSTPAYEAVPTQEKHQNPSASALEITGNKDSNI